MYMTACIFVGKYRRFGEKFCHNLLLFNPENGGSFFAFQCFGNSLPNATAVYSIVFTTSTAVRKLTLVIIKMCYISEVGID
jgi:hypothetical protein